MGKSVIILVIISILFSIILSINASAADYRNAYVIMWDGTPCDNVAYAKSMGYDYVGYQSGMENCANNSNLYFYIESPDQKPDFINNYIYLDKSYSAADKKTLNDMLLWKSNASFPNNIATGWFFDTNYFRPLPDFQQQKVIDLVVNQSLSLITNAENKQNNFLFGGWSWDVPSLGGSLWSGVQNRPLIGQTGTGKQVDISYWTGSCSGIKHPGLSQDYACYADGKAAFYKKLLSETKKLYPNMKTYMEPFIPWSSYIQNIASRSDVAQLKPDLLCEESGGTEFVTDSRLFTTGLMTKDKVCSDTPNVFDHQGNLVIAGNAGINGAWFLWFGRLGGTGNFANYASIRQIPDRLKLIRAMPGWDNLNNVPLKSRSWDATKLQYTSTLSYADMNVIYSVHPKNKKTYFVILNKAAGVNLQGKSVDSVYSVDELFQQKADVTSDFTQSNGYLYLKSDTNVGKGFILTLKTGSTPITPPPVNPPVTPPPTNKTNTTSATCSDTDGGNNTFTKGTVYGKDSSGKNYSYTDTCFMNGNTAMIIEYYCSNSKYKNGNYTCNNGCANNACIPDATTTTATCSDSDGGDNIYTKGIVSTIESTGKSHTYTDTCFMNGNTAMIKEYYCSGTKYQSTNHTCNNGCANNACIEDIPVSPPEDTTLTPPKSSGGHSSPSITGNAIVLYCGDHICTVGKENCSTCSTDCGSCPKTTQIIRPNDNNDSAQQQILKAADNAVSGGLEKTNELSGLLIKEDHNTKTLANTVFMMVFMTIFGGIVFFAIRKSLSI